MKTSVRGSSPAEAQIRDSSADEVRMLVVDIDGVRCGLPLDCVREVLPAARVVVLPGAPGSVMGVVNLRGEPVVVVDGGGCIGRSTQELRADDRFVVLDGVDPHCALRVRGVHDLLAVRASSLVGTPSLGATEPYRADIAVLEDGLLMVRDVASFVTLDDASAIRRALEVWTE